MAEVLFVCVHNAGRSQMAKAMFNRIASERGLTLRAESAGTEPGEGVHDIVATAMQEMGFDLRTELPRLLTDEMVEQAQRVVTMGCAIDSEACPAIFLRDVEGLGSPRPQGATHRRGQGNKGRHWEEGRGPPSRAYAARLRSRRPHSLARPEAETLTAHHEWGLSGITRVWRSGLSGVVHPLPLCYPKV